MMEDKNKDDPSHTQNNGQTEGKVIAFYNKIILLIKLMTPRAEIDFLKVKWSPRPFGPKKLTSLRSEGF